VDDQTVQARIDARKRASVVADLVSDEAIVISEPAREAFWIELWRLLGAQTRPPAGFRGEPMTDKQAKVFGAVLMPFGLHKGKRVDEVPLEYLERLTDPSSFLKEVRRYLASRRIRNEPRDRPSEEE